MNLNRYPLVLLVLFLAAAGLSGFAPVDRFNWVAETFPAWIGAAILVFTHRRFPLTGISYTLIFLFALILLTGGHYTYAEVPLGEWAREAFGWDRNHFDRLGHFFQGVMPAVLARELLLRRTTLHAGPRVFFIACATALAISALYEIFEWRYAVAFGGEQADDFLGSQGDIWDAQKDMSMALQGAVIAQLALWVWHDRQIERLREVLATR